MTELGPTELRNIGKKLYGERWQTPFARSLPVSTRTIRRWLAGKTKPHPAVVARIMQLFKDETSGKA